MASLYQSGSPAGAGRVRRSFSRRASRDLLQEVVEISLRAQPAPEAEHVGRHDTRVQRDEAPWAVPEIPRVAQQVVHLEGLARVERELVERQLDPAALRMVWVEGDDHEHLVRAVG